MEAKSRRDQAPAPQSADWMVWPGPARGYIALGSLPQIADALEALWLLRARQHQMDMLLAAVQGGVLIGHHTDCGG